MREGYMVNHVNSGLPSNSGQFDHPEVDKIGCIDCGVNSEHFPCLGKCCESIIGEAGIAYKKVCGDCSIWMSLPDSESLKISTIFECRRYGYGKRIKE